MWNQVLNFADDNSLELIDEALPRHSFTYLSPAHNTTSWLDHVLASKNLSISDLDIRYDIALFDHFPVMFNLHIGFSLLESNSNTYSSLTESFADWKVVDRNEYVKNVEKFLCNNVICDSVGCEIDHRETIDVNYVYIKNTMMKATKKYLFKNRRKFVQISV